MEIRNEFNSTVFWRVFKSDDTSYALGWTEGTIKPNEILKWTEGQFLQMKIEIRNGTSYTAPLLVRAGKLIDMDARLVVTKEGALAEAAASVKPGSIEKVQRKEIEFVDQLGTDTEIERDVSFSVDNAFSSGRDQALQQENSEEWSVGAKFGGTIGVPDKASVSSEYSAGYKKSVGKLLSESNKEKVTNVWSKTKTQKIAFPGRKLHAVETVWTLDVQHAEAHYFGITTPVTIITDANNSDIRMVSAASVDALPGALKEEYNRRFAASAKR